LAEKGASIIRLDAFAYANKKIGTNCFFVEPDIWEMLNHSEQTVAPYGVTVLPEIHEHYSIQLKIADQDYYVYDFALPMLVLHALFSGKVNRLVHWLEICPRKQFTTLDTHDGIGVVDVKDLLSDEEAEMTRESLYSQGANVKKIYSTEAYNNLDIYQINCTYYSALGNDDQAYLLARAIQCFAPGIPQIYYVGLLAGVNDIELLEKTKEGRNINRHYYTQEEIDVEVERPVVQKLFNILKFRNSNPAFDGDIQIKQLDENNVVITWENMQNGARLEANLLTKAFTISQKGKLADWERVAL
jgi:sucrose phosphorylase